MLNCKHILDSWRKAADPLNAGDARVVCYVIVGAQHGPHHREAHNKPAFCIDFQPIQVFGHRGEQSVFTVFRDFEQISHCQFMESGNASATQDSGEAVKLRVKPAKVQLVVAGHVPALVRHLAPARYLNTALFENALNNALFKSELALKPNGLSAVTVLIEQFVEELVARVGHSQDAVLLSK